MENELNIDDHRKMNKDNLYSNDDDHNIVNNDEVDDDDNDGVRRPPPTQPPPTFNVIGKILGNSKNQGLSTSLDLGRAEIVVTAATPMVEDGIDKSFPPLEEEEEEGEVEEDNKGHSDNGVDKVADRNSNQKDEAKNVNNKDDDKGYQKQIYDKNKDEKIINKATSYGSNRREVKPTPTIIVPKKSKPSIVSNIGRKDQWLVVV